MWAYIDTIDAVSSPELTRGSWRVYSYSSLDYQVQHDVRVTKHGDHRGPMRESSCEEGGEGSTCGPSQRLEAAGPDATDEGEAPCSSGGPALRQTQAADSEQDAGKDEAEERRIAEDDAMRSEDERRYNMEDDEKEAADWSQSWVRSLTWFASFSLPFHLRNVSACSPMLSFPYSGSSIRLSAYAHKNRGRVPRCLSQPRTPPLTPRCNANTHHSSTCKMDLITP